MSKKTVSDEEVVVVAHGACGRFDMIRFPCEDNPVRSEELLFLGLAGPSWLFFEQPVHEGLVLERVAVASLRSNSGNCLF
jgi:hypothetical protein